MRKFSILLALLTLAGTSGWAQITAAPYIRETQVSTAGGVFDDTAFEPGIIGVDARVDPANVFFIENNKTSTNKVKMYRYPANANAGVTAATLFIEGEIPTTNNGVIQTLLGSTNSASFRMGAGDFDPVSARLFWFGVINVTPANEFVGDGDPDALFYTNVDTTASTLVSTSNGIVSAAAVGDSVFVELDLSAGAAQDAIGVIDLTGSLPAAPTTLVDQASLAALLSATAVDLFGLASDGTNIYALAVADSTTPAVIRISDPTGTPSVAVFANGSALNGTSLGTIVPAGIAATLTGEVFVLSANSNADVLATEGIVHIRPSGSVFQAVAASTITGAVGDAHFQVFQDDAITAWEKPSGDIGILVNSQANAEYIAQVTIPNANVPVELSGFSLD